MQLSKKITFLSIISVKSKVNQKAEGRRSGGQDKPGVLHPSNTRYKYKCQKCNAKKLVFVPVQEEEIEEKLIRFGRFNFRSACD